MPKMIILPEAHPEVLLQLAEIARTAYKNASFRNFGNEEYEDKCSLVGKKLFDLATDILSDEAVVIDRADVSKVYFESRKNNATLQLYDKYLKGKDIVWLYDDFPDIDLLTDRARRGVKDKFYYMLQEDAEKHTVKKLVENPPEEGTIGILKYGRKHIEKSDQTGDVPIGNIPKMLRDEGFEVEIMPSKDYDKEIDDHLREIGLDVDGIRLFPMI